MWSYVPPVDDIRFVLTELLDVEAEWRRIPAFAELDADVTSQVLEEAGRFTAETLLPINSSGDVEGCHFVDGTVRTPKGFASAYQKFCGAGWPALACDAEHGGQGLPQTLNAALYEMLNSVNHAWTMYPGLCHGAYECIRAHGSDYLKETYLPKIVSGELLATMCLTEAHAGSDVGLLRTVAVPRADDTYSITGSKIFISGGDHDLTKNILHLVLARLPDAPGGTRGISLFVVPKLLEAGSGIQSNGVNCVGIEKKMGIKGSATCALRFESAQGWLVGEPNRGLAAMFVMMNAARMYVGLQGLGHAEMALQNASRYAAERLQMRSPGRPGGSEAAGAKPPAAVPIAFHPPVRRILATAKALVEGQRALAYWIAHMLDVAAYHPNDVERDSARELASLLTPVVKAFLTDNGFSISSMALQIWGGYGYVHDFGIEQTVRDSRIAMIYEGTNEIQSIDLLVRKVLADGGSKYRMLERIIADEAATCREVPECAELGVELARVLTDLSAATSDVLSAAAESPEMAHNVAGDYLHALGLVTLAYLWAKTARVVARPTSASRHAQKRETARFFFDYVLPEAEHRFRLIGAGRRPLPWLEA